MTDPTPGPRNSSRMKSIVVLGVIVAALVGFGAFSVNQSLNAANAFLADLRSENLEGAIARMRPNLQDTLRAGFGTNALHNFSVVDPFELSVEGIRFGNGSVTVTMAAMAAGPNGCVMAGMIEASPQWVEGVTINPSCPDRSGSGIP